jgi:hypothetical protein
MDAEYRNNSGIDVNLKESIQNAVFPNVTNKTSTCNNQCGYKSNLQHLV